MIITAEIANSFAAYVETAAFFFNAAHKGGVAAGMSEQLATVFAKQVLDYFLQPRQEEAKTPDLSALMARLSPGGSA